MFLPTSLCPQYSSAFACFSIFTQIKFILTCASLMIVKWLPTAETGWCKGNGVSWNGLLQAGHSPGAPNKMQGSHTMQVGGFSNKHWAAAWKGKEGKWMPNAWPLNIHGNQPTPSASWLPLYLWVPNWPQKCLANLLVYVHICCILNSITFKAKNWFYERFL